MERFSNGHLKLGLLGITSCPLPNALTFLLLLKSIMPYYAENSYNSVWEITHLCCVHLKANLNIFLTTNL